MAIPILQGTGQLPHQYCLAPSVNSAEAETPGCRNTKVGRRMTETRAVEAGGG